MPFHVRDSRIIHACGGILTLHIIRAALDRYGEDSIVHASPAQKLQWELLGVHLGELEYPDEQILRMKKYFLGLEVICDRAIPADVMQFRATNGDLLGEIRGLAIPNLYEHDEESEKCQQPT